MQLINDGVLNKLVRGVGKISKYAINGELLKMGDLKII